jgi:acetylglutamate/LysW-gamma-L-alpha-aminoadipate kinase
MIVVKVGGGKDLNIDAIVADIVNLRGAGHELLLVHGGAETTNEVAEALGHPPAIRHQRERLRQPAHRPPHAGDLRDGLLRPAQQDVGGEAANGRRQRRRAERAGRAHLRGTRKDTLRVRIDGKRMVLRDDWTGTVERINTHLLRTLLDAGYLPGAYSARRVGQGRGDQRGRRPRRGNGGGRVPRRGADHPQQRAWACCATSPTKRR